VFWPPVCIKPIPAGACASRTEWNRFQTVCLVVFFSDSPSKLQATVGNLAELVQES
jgi:hypothetical protein